MVAIKFKIWVWIDEKQYHCICRVWIKRLVSYGRVRGYLAFYVVEGHETGETGVNKTKWSSQVEFGVVIGLLPCLTLDDRILAGE